MGLIHVRQVVGVLAGLRGDARAVRHAFARHPPRIASRSRPSAWARSHRELLLRSLSHQSAGIRHAAAWMLGAAGTRTAVAPLVQLAARGSDFFDHDYAYQALVSLGTLAHAPLVRLALGAPLDIAAAAVQALGQSPKSLRSLRRVVASGRRIPHLFDAFFNQHDPNGLRDLLPALAGKDRRARSDALSAAEDLLEHARERPRVLASIDARRWGSVLARLARSGSHEDRLEAIACLGWLRDERSLPLVVAGTRHRDAFGALVAIESLGRYQTPASRAALISLLASPRLARSTAAATALAADPGVDAPLRALAEVFMLRGVLELDDEGFEWIDAARGLLRTRRGRAALRRAAANGTRRQRRRSLAALSEQSW